MGNFVYSPIGSSGNETTCFLMNSQIVNYGRFFLKKVLKLHNYTESVEFLYVRGFTLWAGYGRL